MSKESTTETTALSAAHDAGEFMLLDIDCIVPSPTNPRTVFNLPRLEEMAVTIRASGVHTPVLVRPLPASRLQETFEGRRKGAPLPTHELIAGERRYRASKIAEAKTLPAMVRTLTDEQVLEIQLIENLQRDDLHPMEEAEGYEKLIDATGVSKEQLAEKIGRSRAYVYGRLKLLNLCPEARKAFYLGESEGGIDSSRALVVARIPDAKLQLKALEEATRKDWGGGLQHNFKGFVRWAQQNVMLRLDSARFKITDAALVPDAGSCRACSKRTGAQPDVYADVDSADVCTDPSCYHAKDSAHEQIVIDQARATGQQVILEKEAKSIWQYEHTPLKGYTRLDRPDARVHSTKTLKTVLGKGAPQPVLMQNPHKKGELIEVLPTAQVTKLLKESGKIEVKQKVNAGSAAAAQVAAEGAKPVEQRREYHNRWQAEALRQADAHFKGWTGEVPPGLLRWFLLNMLAIADEGPFGPALDLGTEFDTSDAHNRLNTLPDSAMPEVFIRWMLHDTESGYPSAWTIEQRNQMQPRHPTWQILDLAGVDVDAILAETKRAMESDDRAAELAKAEKAVKAQKPEKSNAPPAAQKKRAGKPSAEEVQAEIAEKLQALDQAPAGAEQEGAADAAQDKDEAPDGATEQGGAAPAAPAAPEVNVGDRVIVVDRKYSQFDKEGTVAKLHGLSKACITFNDGTDATLPAAALKVTSAALWPFPTRAATPAFAIGDIARVKDGSGGPTKHLRKLFGKVGRVCGLVGDGRVQLRYGERSGEMLTINPTDLEHYKADPLIGSKVRIVGMSAGEAFLWRHGVVKECTNDGWGVTLTGKNGTTGDVGVFQTADLEVLA